MLNCNSAVLLVLCNELPLFDLCKRVLLLYKTVYSDCSIVKHVSGIKGATLYLTITLIFLG